MVVNMKYVNSCRLSVEFLAVVYIKLVPNAVRPAAKHCSVLFHSPVKDVFSGGSNSPET